MTGPGRSLHNIHYRTLAGLLGLVISGCTRPPPQPSTVTPPVEVPIAPTAGSGPPVASEPAVPLPPPGLPVTAVEARFGVTSMPLQATGSEPPLVDPGSTFEVRLPFAARGARLVLLDARDAMVPSSADSEIGTTSRFTLVPLEPLPPGSRHVLRLEGLANRLVISDDGRAFEPLVAPFRVAGEPPPAPPRRAKKKRGG
jgi:hypothetical protein